MAEDTSTEPDAQASTAVDETVPYVHCGSCGGTGQDYTPGEGFNTSIACSGCGGTGGDFMANAMNDPVGRALVEAIHRRKGLTAA